MLLLRTGTDASESIRWLESGVPTTTKGVTGTFHYTLTIKHPRDPNRWFLHWVLISTTLFDKKIRRLELGPDPKVEKVGSKKDRKVEITGKEFGDLNSNGDRAVFTFASKTTADRFRESIAAIKASHLPAHTDRGSSLV